MAKAKKSKSKFSFKLPPDFMEKFKALAKTFWFKFLCSFVCTFLVLGGVALGFYGYIFGELGVEKGLSDDETGITNQDYHVKGIENIALFGIDTTDDEMKGRSDSIIIVTLDHNRKEVRLSAIERDTYVSIEGHGQDKINHAYAFGGPALAVKTLNQNFGLNIKDYAVVNFSNMVKVIDALGGVNMDVPQKYVWEVNKFVKSHNSKYGTSSGLIENGGEQLLNGVQALCMARVRKSVGGTNVRAGMHEIILEACFARLKEKNVLEYPNIAKTLLSLVKTTLKSGEVTSIAAKVALSGYKIRDAVFPLKQDWLSNNMINGIWYRTYNTETGNENIRKFIYQGVLPEGVE